MGTVHAKSGPVTSIPELRHEKINYEECLEAKQIPLSVSARVDKIHVDGLQRTKNDCVQAAVRDVFTATNFEEVLFKAHRAREKLAALTCFRNISVHIDVSRGPSASPDGVEVTFFVKELKRVIGGINTQVGNNEGSLIIGLKTPNMFGRGERVQAEWSYGSKKSHNFNVAFVKPFMGKLNPVVTTTGYQNMAEFPVSGFKQLDKGAIFDIAFNSLEFLKHNIQYDATIRELYPLSRGSSFDIREKAGVSLKSAVRHVLTADGRDEKIFPTCGSLCQMTSEFAGLGGDVGFMKNELYMQANYCLLRDIVLQATLSGGHMVEVGSDKKIGPSDMFYIGGPLSVRGFLPRGIGPQADNDALGSLCYWTGGLHLYTPLPFQPGRGGLGEYFRTHFFLNAGNVTLPESDENVMDQLKKNIRITTGVGVAIRLGQLARVEVNYCVPVQHDKDDRLSPGVQFGVGVQFI